MLNGIARRATSRRPRRAGRPRPARRTRAARSTRAPRWRMRRGTARRRRRRARAGLVVGGVAGVLRHGGRADHRAEEGVAAGVGLAAAPPTTPAARPADRAGVAGGRTPPLATMTTAAPSSAGQHIIAVSGSAIIREAEHLVDGHRRGRAAGRASGLSGAVVPVLGGDRREVSRAWCRGRTCAAAPTGRRRRPAGSTSRAGRVRLPAIASPSVADRSSRSSCRR